MSRTWPVHLVAIILGGLVGVYTASKLFDGDPRGVLVWLVAGVLLHDLLLVPAYTAVDRVARSAAGPASSGEPSVPFWYDHIRVPVLLSGLLLLVFFPLILGIPKKFSSITGTSVDVYLGRYLAMVAGLFAISALALLVRLAGRRHRGVESVERPAP